MKPTPNPCVTICVLTFGDHLDLAKRAIESILALPNRSQFELVVGANAVGPDTDTYLEALTENNSIDRLIKSTTNINKCPMMRRMFEGIDSEFIWWFDDDSYISAPSALEMLLSSAGAAPKETVMWGTAMYLDCAPDIEHGPRFARQFVRSASWYRGLTPPSWETGGKGEMDFDGQGGGDGRWSFIVGGCWLLRTSAMRALDWPDPRLVKGSDDVYLGEAIRQQGWLTEHVGLPVAVNQAERRGNPGLPNPECVTSASLSERNRD